VELTGRDIWTGPNGSSKSTRLEGFLIALLGYIPGYKKELSDVYRLASDEEMGAGLEMSDGFKFTRTIRERCTKKKSGERVYSLTEDVVDLFPLRGEKNPTDRKNRVSKELGDISMLLDLGKFFSMSDAERRKFIFSLTDPSQFGWDRKRVVNELIGTNEKFVGWSGHVESMWDDTVGVQENVARILEWAKSELSTKKAEVKRAQAAKEQLLAQKRELGSDPGSAAEIAAELKGARESLAKLIAEVSAAQAKVRSAVNLKNRIERLQNQVNAPAPKVHPEEAIKAVEDSAIASRAEVAKLSEERNRIDAECKRLEAEIDSCTPAVRKADARVGSIQGLITKIEGTKGICPLLGEKCQSDLGSYVTKLKDELVEADRVAHEASEKRKGFEKELALNREEVRKLTKKIEQESAQAAAADRTMDSMSKSNAMAGKDAETRENARLEMARAEDELRELGLVDIMPLEAARDGMSGRVHDLDRELTKRQAIANLLSSFDRANVEADELSEKADILDDLVRFLGPDNLQGKILKDTIGPLVEKINALLDKTGRGYSLKVVLEGKNGQQVLDFAWERNGRDITFATLSGGEKVVFGVALCTALVLAKNPPCKTLVVEASECDEGNLRALMEAVGQLGPELDNVLVASWATPPAVEGWKVHKMDSPKKTEMSDLGKNLFALGASMMKTQAEEKVTF